MRIEGRLIRWNDQRGFGFIAPTQGGPEIFVHISAFPRNARTPVVGERLLFETHSDDKGKRRAINLACPDRISPPASRPRPRQAQAEKPVGRKVMGLVVLMFMLALYGYEKFSQHTGPAAAIASTNTEATPHLPQPVLPKPTHKSGTTEARSFKCDGRTYCSQMTSCAEAEYFLKNCPNVKMDGNHDGVPCERQWCG